MSLIIKADMPKGCCWEQESGCFDICKLRKVCGRGVSDKPFMTGYRHPDCPIIGEIPDKHGRLIDADKLIHAFDYRTDLPTGYDIYTAIAEAETIVEATE